MILWKSFAFCVFSLTLLSILSKFIYSFQYLNAIYPEAYNIILSKVISSTALASNQPNILSNERFFGNYENKTNEIFNSVNFSAKE